MKNKVINSASIALVMVLAFLLAANAFGQDMRSGTHKEGYGSYKTMGQDPDENNQFGSSAQVGLLELSSLIELIRTMFSPSILGIAVLKKI